MAQAERFTLMAHTGSNPPDHTSGPRPSLSPVSSPYSSSSSSSSSPSSPPSLSSLSMSSSSAAAAPSSPSSSSSSPSSSSSSSMCSFPSHHALRAQHPIDRRISSISPSSSLRADASPSVPPVAKQAPAKRKKIGKVKCSICPPPAGNGRLDEMPAQVKLTKKRASSKVHKSKKSPYAGACCTCTAGVAADCAAVCCCPVAVLQLLALSFVKLPCVVVWRMFLRLKKHLCSGGPSDCVEDDMNIKVDIPRQSFGSPPWSSPQRPPDPFAQVVRFETQSLWTHFEAGCVGFGGHTQEDGLIHGLPFDMHCDLN